MKGLFIREKKLYLAMSHARSLNSVTGEWEVHVLYCLVDNSEYCTMEKKSFIKNFEEIKDQKVLNVH